ncbi:MAG: dUTP diphosphatase [Actinomycetota bacterium]|nr:dUTP diphosphatase [Actinomycetota bacterium]MDA2980170.1 dUTP diphosphatase [Actinomycetota bacterium]MDA3002514.1 dUTP diphosphatase [Actinomycetota bacterium]
MTHELTPEVLITGVEPTYAHPGDAGADLRAASAHTLAPGERALVPTGTSVALPHGYVAYVMPRSGLALRHGIGLVNAPGVIDAGYRGEISVIVINHDPRETFTIEPGDRIAQLVISPVARALFQPVTALPGSKRDTGGFGSTGVSQQGESA